MAEKNCFDLYFAGSWHSSSDNLIAKLGLPRLFSQVNDRSGIKKFIELGSKSKLFIDSGAHTAHTKQIEIDVNEYIEYVNNIDEYITVFAQVDKIPGQYLKPKTIEDWQNAPKESWDNFLYMYPRVKSPEKLMPVFHQGENFDWLKNMLEWRSLEGNRIMYIGLSPRGDVSVKVKVDFLCKCYKVIKSSSNPLVKTHALGMTSLDELTRFPLTSADSTTWLLISAMGQIMTPWGLVNVSSKQAERKGSIFVSTKEEKEKVSEYISRLGFTLEDASADYKVRNKLNILFLYNWVKEYQRVNSYTRTRKVLF